jgi:hypothetical protein
MAVEDSKNAMVLIVRKYPAVNFPSEARVIGMKMKKVMSTTRLIVMAIEFQITAFLLVRISLAEGFLLGGT